MLTRSLIVLSPHPHARVSAEAIGIGAPRAAASVIESRIVRYSYPASSDPQSMAAHWI